MTNAMWGGVLMLVQLTLIVGGFFAEPIWGHRMVGFLLAITAGAICVANARLGQAELASLSGVLTLFFLGLIL